MGSVVPTDGLDRPDEGLTRAAGEGISCKPVHSYRKIRKMSFYSHVRSDQIGIYQDYLNRAFAISPTLEFDENDRRLNGLFQEATENDALHELDLEMMMRQFVNTNGRLREKYRADWVERVLSRQADGVIPDPWDIIAAAFVK